MTIVEIDCLPPGKEKLRRYISFALRYNQLHNLPEIGELYQRLKRDGAITQDEYNKMFIPSNTTMDGEITMTNQNQPNKELSLREQLLAAGMKEEEVDTRYSDLQVLKNDISTPIIEAYGASYIEFDSEIDGKEWYEIPGADFGRYAESKMRR